MKKVLNFLTNVTYSNCNTVVLYCVSALFIVYFTVLYIAFYVVLHCQCWDHFSTTNSTKVQTDLANKLKRHKKV